MTEMETLEHRVRQLEDENVLVAEAVKMALSLNGNLLRMLHLKRNHPKLKQLTDQQNQVIAEALEMLPPTVCPDCRQIHALVPGIQ